MRFANALLKSVARKIAAGNPSPRRGEEKRHAVPFATMLDPWAINGHSVAGWRLPANLAG
jgi:hypothetical protein